MDKKVILIGVLLLMAFMGQAQAQEITNFSPTNLSVTNQIGEMRTFDITVDQEVNVSWLINDVEVFMDMNVTTSSYTNTSAFAGTIEVKAIATNENGSDNVTWDWIITDVSTFNISGFKVDDNNSNGIWDEGEPGIENWNIMLKNESTGEMIDQTITDNEGFFQFANLSNGTYNVTEEMRTEWINTNQNFQIVTIDGNNVEDIIFTNNQTEETPIEPNATTFNISGFKVEDNNSNSIWDEGEPGIENWNIMLKNESTGEMIDQTITDNEGFFQFANLSNGTYNVTEEMRTGWINTNQNFQIVTIDGNDVEDVIFTNNQTEETPIEPNATTFNISGFKVEDNNSDGIWDEGEPGIENWNIMLKNESTGEMIDQTITDNEGFFQFANLSNGTYNVTEEMRTGWINTNQNFLIVTIDGNDVEDIIFTNNQTEETPIPIEPNATRFDLEPDASAVYAGDILGITIRAMTENGTDMNYSGIANINITADNVSAVDYPENVTFANGEATMSVESDLTQFVMVQVTDDTISGSTTVAFADKVFPLEMGWNLISIPNNADPSSIDQALQNVENDGLVGLDHVSQTFLTPTDLEPLHGYWINVTAENQAIGFMADENVLSLPPSRLLYEGWNMIGISAQRDDPIELAAGRILVSLKYGEHFTQWHYSQLVMYDNGQPITLEVGTNDAIDLTDYTTLEQGKGYLLFIKDIPNTDQNSVPWAGKSW